MFVCVSPSDSKLKGLTLWLGVRVLMAGLSTPNVRAGSQLASRPSDGVRTKIGQRRSNAVQPAVDGDNLDNRNNGPHIIFPPEAVLVHEKISAKSGPLAKASRCFFVFAQRTNIIFPFISEEVVQSVSATVVATCRSGNLLSRPQ